MAVAKAVAEVKTWACAEFGEDWEVRPCKRSVKEECVLTSTVDYVEQWKGNCDGLLNPGNISACKEEVAEISGVLESNFGVRLYSLQVDLEKACD